MVAVANTTKFIGTHIEQLGQFILAGKYGQLDNHSQLIITVDWNGAVVSINKNAKQ